MLTLILTSIIALLVVALVLTDKESRNLKSERDSAVSERDNLTTYYASLIDQWEAYSAYLETQLHDTKLDLRFVRQPEYTVHTNGTRTIAQPLPGMGFDSKKYQAGFDSEGHIIAVEKPAKVTPVVKSTDNKPASQPAKQNGNKAKQTKTVSPVTRNDQRNDSSPIVPDTAANVISQVVAQTGKGKLSAIESDKANKLIKGWIAKGIDSDKMIELLVNMRNKGYLAK